MTISGQRRQGRRLLRGGGARHPRRDGEDHGQREGDERRQHPQHEDPPVRRREEPAAELGADDQVHDERVEQEAHRGGEVAGDEAGHELAEVDLALGGGGVGEELAAAPLALADDRVRADRRRHRQRHDDRERVRTGRRPARTTRSPGPSDRAPWPAGPWAGCRRRRSASWPGWRPSPTRGSAAGTSG